MSGTGFQGRDPNRDDKPSHVRLPGHSGSHIPVVPSPVQPTGELIKSYHANMKVRPIVPAPVSNVNMAAAQVVTPSIIPKIPTGQTILSALQPQISLPGVTVASTQPIGSLSVSSVSGGTAPLNISNIQMASLIRSVPPVIQQAVNQATVTSHSTLIAPHPVHFPIQVPRSKQGGNAVLRPATPVMSTHAGAAAILSNYIPRAGQVLPVRPTASSTPPVTRSGSPSVPASVASSQDQHRTGIVPQQTVLSSAAASSMQFTIQQPRQVMPSSKTLNIPQPVLQAQNMQKLVVTPTSLTNIQQNIPISSTVKQTALPLNLQVQGHGQVNVPSTTFSTAANVAVQPSVPIAKVPPQRQVAHMGVQNRESREMSVTSTVASLQSLHRASPITTVSSTAVTVSSSIPAQMQHAEARPQDRPNVMQPYMQQPNYAEFYTTNLMNSQYLMYQQLAHQFPQVTTGGPAIRPSLVPTQASSLVATIQPAATSGQQPMRINPMVVTVDPNRHSAVSAHAQLKTSTDTQVTGSTGTATTSVPSAAHVVTSLQGALNQHQSAPVQPPGVNPTASPRPSILRKRPAEGVPMVKKSLASALSTVESSPLSEIVSQSLTASPKPPPYNPSGENSQSSTDTATSADSTPPSSHGDVKPAVKQENVESLENGLVTPGTPITSTNEASPRKKPRKQLLHATEELKDDHSSTDEEVERINSSKIDLKRQMEKAAVVAAAEEEEDSAQEAEEQEKLKQMLEEFTDDEGVRWVKERRRPNISLMNHYTCTWKTKNNHFLRHQDVKCKEERRPTVNELSNQKGVAQKASGWKLYHLAGQMEEMMDLEKDVFCKLQEVQDCIAPKGIAKCTMEDDIGMVHELSQGSIQRCKLLTDQLGEAKASMIRILEHKDRALGIIQKHHSKRPVKKKERS